MYVSSEYFNVNPGTDIDFQALSVFKIVILLLIVIAGAFDIDIYFLLSQYILDKDGWCSAEKLVSVTHMPTFTMPLPGAPTAVMM